MPGAPKNGMLALMRWLLIGVCLVSLNAAAQTSAPPSLLLADDDPRADALATALRVELAGAGWTILRGPSPQGVTPIERASSAQRAAREAGARVAMWVEAGPEGGALLRAVEVDGESTRHAPLPAPVVAIEARTFAVVASSLVDEIRTPPARVRVRVSVSVEGEGIVVDGASARVATPDGREGTAQLDANGNPLDGTVIEVPAETIEEAIERQAAEAEAEAERQAEEAEAAIEAAAEATEEAAEAMEEAMETQVVVGVDGQPIDRETRTFFGADVAPYVGTSSVRRGRETRTISLGLLGAYSRAVEGVALSSGLNITREHMHGAALAGGANIAGGSVEGAQLAGGFNWSRGELRGAQVAGGMNVHVGDFEGAQISGGLNIATGRFRGLQASGGLNFARGGSGVQAGVLNISRGNLDGVQLGLLNISDDATFALGLVNVVREGRTHIEVSGTAEGFGFSMLKHGGEHWHYLYSVGGRPFGDEPVYSLGLGLGGHLKPSERLFLDIEGLVHYLSDGDHGDDGTEVLSQARLMLGIQVFKRLALVGGVTYNVLSAYNDDSSYAQAGEVTLADTSGVGWRVTGWPSVTLGVQIL